MLGRKLSEARMPNPLLNPIPQAAPGSSAAVGHIVENSIPLSVFPIQVDKFCIIFCGLPGRGKSFIARRLARFCFYTIVAFLYADIIFIQRLSTDILHSFMRFRQKCSTYLTIADNIAVNWGMQNILILIMIKHNSLEIFVMKWLDRTLLNF